MSGAQAVERALARLRGRDAVLAASRGGYGVFRGPDRRRRPLARLTAHEVRTLLAEGVLAERAGGVFVLSDAGQARARRLAAGEEDAFLAQHAPIVARHVVDARGLLRPARGLESGSAARRLAALRDSKGAPWLSADEAAAAARLQSEWVRAQTGLVKGSDWSAPPRGDGARGPGNAQEAALAARCDASRRVGEALEALAPPLRRVVERVCLREEGLEALERDEGWPARSGKIALKLGLAQLAASGVLR